MVATNIFELKIVFKCIEQRPRLEMPSRLTFHYCLFIFALNINIKLTI